MRIALLHWGFPPIIGGVETHLALLGPELVRRGHKVFLLTGSVEGVKGEYFYRGMWVSRTPLLDLNWLYSRRLEGLEEEISQTINHFLERVKPDVIHAHNFHYFSRAHAETLEKNRDCPLILTAHNSWDDDLCLELSTKIDWDAIIAVSHFIKKELVGLGVQAEKITVIHHGMDTKLYSPLNKIRIGQKHQHFKNRRIIFHPARMGLAKGNDVGIKALRLVKKEFSDVLLVMAGTKNIIDWGDTQQRDIAYLLLLIKEFNLRENVLIDFFSLKQMRELYAICDFCWYPSSFGEPFGLTLLESLAFAKPMIVTDSGGMTEIIRDGYSGFVIGVKDWEALAEKAILLLSDEKLRKKMGERGRKMVEKKFNLGRMVDDVLKVYEGVK